MSTLDTGAATETAPFAWRRGATGPSFRFFLVLIGIGLLGGGFCMLARSTRELHLAADATTPESALVETALWARQTGQIYRPYWKPPYTPTPYTPLYYVALIGLSHWTGPNFDRLLAAGRAFTFLCFLAIVALVFAWARRLGLGTAASALGAGFVLSEIAFANWDISTRPDVPALLCSLAAVYLMSRESGRPRTGDGRWAGGGATAPGAASVAPSAGVHARSRPLAPRWPTAVAAGFFAAAALLFKQSYWAAPLAIAVWLASQRRWREEIAFVAAGAALSLGTLGAFALRGGHVIANLLALRHAAPSVATGLGMIARSLEAYAPHGLLLALALAGAAAALARGDRRLQLAVLYCALAWLLGAATLILNSGATENYLLEGWTSAAVLAAVAIPTLAREWGRAPATVRALLLLLTAFMVFPGIVAWHHAAFTARPIDRSRLAAAVHGRRVLSDIPYLAAHGRNPEYLDPYLLHTLELAGAANSAALVRQIDDRAYDLVLLDLSQGRANTVWRGVAHYDHAAVAALAANYRLHCDAHGIGVFTPLGRPLDAPLARALARAQCRAPGAIAFNLARR